MQFCSKIFIKNLIMLHFWIPLLRRQSIRETWASSVLNRTIFPLAGQFCRVSTRLRNHWYNCSAKDDLNKLMTVPEWNQTQTNYSALEI